MDFLVLIKKTLYWSCLLTILIACGEETPNEEVIDDREGITKLVLTLESPNNPNALVFSYEDTEGADPVVQTQKLSAGALYFSTIEVFKGETNLTDEINLKNTEHQYFYIVNDADLKVTYADQDDDGLPLGGFVAIRTGAKSTGSLVINLSHKPNKSGQGVSEGNLLNAGGRTDIQANFPIEIE